MARAKKLLVEDLLKLMDEDEKVCISFFAYNIHLTNSTNDGLQTVKDCREQLNFDCKRAQVGKVGVRDGIQCFAAEIIHN